MQKIIIICEDTFGLDVYAMIDAINRNNLEKKYEVFGFLSDRSDAFGTIAPPKPLLGTVQDWNPEEDYGYVMAIRDPQEKERTANLMKSRGAHFETLIAPWVLMNLESCTFGEGCIVANYCAKVNSRFGDFVTMDTLMAETVEIGDYSTLEAFANITSAKIGRGVYVGPHAAIMSKLNIGDGAYVEAGSVVVSNVKPGMRVSGVPARKVRNK